MNEVDDVCLKRKIEELMLNYWFFSDLSVKRALKTVKKCNFSLKSLHLVQINGNLYI
jgi:hypothetical protein